MNTLAQALISGVAIAVVSAFITVKLALRRFYAEKWWEQKLSAYSRILEALFQMKLYADEQLYAYNAQREISAERDSELGAHWRAGRHEIDRAAALGAFVISHEASACLAKFQSDLEAAQEEEHYVVSMYGDAAAVKQCLDRMRELAKADLGVSGVRSNRYRWPWRRSLPQSTVAAAQPRSR